MGRRVKLQDLGEFGNSDNAYKGTDNKYYSSEEAYLKILEDKADREKCVEIVFNLLEYEPGQKISTIFFKKLKEYEPYGYKVILKTLEKSLNSLEWAMMNKNFDSDNGKIFYIMAVVNNNINDVKRECNKEEKLTKQAQKEEKCRIDMPNVDITNIGTKKKGSDVSSLLGDI